MRSLVLLAALALLAACSEPKVESPSGPQSGLRLVFEVQKTRPDDTLSSEQIAAALQSSVDVTRRRADFAGFSDAVVNPVQPDRIEVLVSGRADPSKLAKLIASPGVFSLHLVDADADSSAYELGVERDGQMSLPDDSRGGQPVVIFTEQIISGRDLSGAMTVVDLMNRPAVSFDLSPVGEKKFGEATSHYIGRSIAIVVDGRIVSAPIIQAPVTAGSVQITGNFTREEADRLTIVLRAGASPARLVLIETSTFGDKQPR